MNQVSWRRILERVEDEEPTSDGAATDPNDHAEEKVHQGQSYRAGIPARDGFEDELTRSLRDLHGADHPPRQHQPSYRPDDRAIAGARSGRQRGHRAEPRSVPMPRPDRPHPPAIQPQPKRQTRGGGAKNLFAIALSLSIVGFAFYQISAEYNQARDAGSATPVSEERVAALEERAPNTSGDANSESGAARFEGNRMDLRPSLAERSDDKVTESTLEVRSLPTSATIEGAASETPASGPSAPPEKVIADIRNGSEQLMLRRGHEMLEQGRIAGARLVFEHLADQNSPLGAFALAQSYDSRFLGSKGIEGAQPNDELAAQWYQRAAELTGQQLQR